MFTDILDYTGTFVTAIATAVATWGGTVFFYRQRKRGLEIENEAKQSDEWRKLYLDSQQDSDRKDQKIDELRREIAELRRALNRLDRQVQLNSIYRCEIVGCERRIPPMHHREEHSILPDADRFDMHAPDEPLFDRTPSTRRYPDAPSYDRLTDSPSYDRLPDDMPPSAPPVL